MSIATWRNWLRQSSWLSREIFPIRKVSFSSALIHIDRLFPHLIVKKKARKSVKVESGSITECETTFSWTSFSVCSYYHHHPHNWDFALLLLPICMLINGSSPFRELVSLLRIKRFSFSSLSRLLVFWCGWDPAKIVIRYKTVGPTQSAKPMIFIANFPMEFFICKRDFTIELSQNYKWMPMNWIAK